MRPDSDSKPARSGSSPIAVRALGDVADVRALERAHHGLFAASERPHVGTAYPYLIADAASSPPERSWQVFTASQDGELVGCLYGRLAERRIKRMRVPVFELGSRFVADPLVRPVDRTDTTRCLLESLMETRSDCAIFFFPRLSEPAFELLTRAAIDLDLPWRWRWSTYAYAFDTTIEVDKFLARLDGDRRRDLDRRRRRLARVHGGAFVRENQLGPAADMHRFEAFAALEDSGWKGRSGTSILRRPGYGPFFRELVQSASRAGMLEWYTLQANGRPIAMYLTLRTTGTRWLPKIGYDENYAAHAPGLLLKHHVLLDSIADPTVGRVENISGTPWVQAWKPERVDFRSLTLFRPGASGRILRCGITLKDLARRLGGRRVVLPGPGDRPFL